MAIASYEWMAAITLVVVAFLFVPTFLKSGIYTIPEFLEYRYNSFARTVMAISTWPWRIQEIIRMGSSVVFRCC